MWLSNSKEASGEREGTKQSGESRGVQLRELTETRTYGALLDFTLYHFKICICYGLVLLWTELCSCPQRPNSYLEALILNVTICGRAFNEVKVNKHTDGALIQ